MMPAPGVDGLRPYQPEDLDRVLRFVGECCAQTDFCGGLHPGDIGHAISNTLRGRDVDKHLYLCEDGQGKVIALLLIHPARSAGFELVVDPAYRSSDLETEWLAVGSRLAFGVADNIGTEVMNCEVTRRDALLSLGFTADEAPSMMFTMRSLDVLIPEVVLPEGFTIRSVAGEQEAALLGEVHSGAFGSNWPPGEYLNVMRSPAFEIERELVVVAPDGRFAAFLVYWIDPVSQAGLFEPVGCHPDFQRRGLTKALMYEGMRRMTARGMKTAAVLHHTDNLASTALYRSVGFEPKYMITTYRKHKALSA